MLFDRLNRYIYHFLGLKELLIEIFIQVMHTCLMLKRHRLVFQFASFQADKSVGESILLFGRDVLPDNLYQVGKGITARLTTKSNVCFSSSSRAWRKVTFLSPMALATSVATRTFLPMLSTRWNFVSGKRMVTVFRGIPLRCRGP